MRLSLQRIYKVKHLYLKIPIIKNENPLSDADLRDSENVPLKENIEKYFKREVLPHLPDAWIDHSKTKIG